MTDVWTNNQTIGSGLPYWNNKCISSVKVGEKLRTAEYKRASFTEAHRVGLDARKFGLHSLRSGGASAAASAGIPDRVFKCHSYWSSEKCQRRVCQGLFEE